MTIQDKKSYVICCGYKGPMFQSEEEYPIGDIEQEIPKSYRYDLYVPVHISMTLLERFGKKR